MKKLSKLKLNVLHQKELDERQMSIIRGRGTPGTCSCGCYNYNTTDNCNTNNIFGYTKSKENPDSAGCCACGSQEAFATFTISNPIYE
jgi:natural product precursor